MKFVPYYFTFFSGFIFLAQCNIVKENRELKYILVLPNDYRVGTYSSYTVSFVPKFVLYCGQGA